MNTLKLNQYGVKELSPAENQDIEGGLAALVIYGGILLIGIAVGMIAGRR